MEAKRKLSEQVYINLVEIKLILMEYDIQKQPHLNIILAAIKKCVPYMEAIVEEVKKLDKAFVSEYDAHVYLVQQGISNYSYKLNEKGKAIYVADLTRFLLCDKPSMNNYEAVAIVNVPLLLEYYKSIPAI
jgi:hypothetical protein